MDQQLSITNRKIQLPSTQGNGRPTETVERSAASRQRSREDDYEVENRGFLLSWRYSTGWHMADCTSLHTCQNSKNELKPAMGTHTYDPNTQGAEYGGWWPCRWPTTMTTNWIHPNINYKAELWWCICWGMLIMEKAMYGQGNAQYRKSLYHLGNTAKNPRQH